MAEDPIHNKRGKSTIPLDDLKEIKSYLKQAEDLYFGDWERPDDPLFDPEFEAHRDAKASVLLVAADDLLQKSAGNHPAYYKRIYYLVRIIVPVDQAAHNYIDGLDRFPVDTHVRDRIIELATQGRKKNLDIPVDKAGRIRTGRIYQYKKETWAPQIPDPRRDINTAVCGNCREPVSFNQAECPCCHVSFFGPVGIPSLERWENATVTNRRNLEDFIIARRDKGRPSDLT
jgi:hypothetical protein